MSGKIFNSQFPIFLPSGDLPQGDNQIPMIQFSKKTDNQKTASSGVEAAAIGQRELRVAFVTEQTSFFLRTLGQVVRSAFRRSYQTCASTFVGGGLSTRALQLLEPSENSETYHAALGLFRHPAVNMDYNLILESRQTKNHAFGAVFADSIKHGKGIGIPKASIAKLARCNKKPAYLADLSEFRVSSILLPCQGNFSVAKVNILSSPGPEGDCTPETLLDRGGLGLTRAQGVFIIA